MLNGWIFTICGVASGSVCLLLQPAQQSCFKSMKKLNKKVQLPLPISTCSSLMSTNHCSPAHQGHQIWNVIKLSSICLSVRAYCATWVVWATDAAMCGATVPKDKVDTVANLKNSNRSNFLSYLFYPTSRLTSSYTFIRSLKCYWSEYKGE